MPEPNWKNRTLFHGDNLPFLRAMNSESVDLIATDPPFNKNKDFHATPGSLAAGAKFQDRWSWERDVHEEWTDKITDDYPRLMEAIESARYAHSDGMGAFMCFMSVRLLEMRRILKPTGSLYLHCDATASHYLKACLDSIFGHRNFRNEIVWQRDIPGKRGKRKIQSKDGQRESRQWPRIHDVILMYSKAPYFMFYPQYLELTDKQKKRYCYQEVDGRLYATSHLGNYSQKSIDKMLDKGLIHISKTGNKRKKYYLDESKGSAVGSIWQDIHGFSVHSKAEERTGYPTQKPLPLLERIISASSSPGDVVLDPFAGCATTCVAAERLGREWVGIDIWAKAHDVVIDRMQSTVGVTGKITYTDQLPIRTDDKQEAAPFLRVKVQVQEPPGSKMSRKEMYAHLVEQYGPRCQGCDRQFDSPRYLELDHNTPRADGGINHISNRVLLCSPCNRAKSHRFTLSGLREKNRKDGFMQHQTPLRNSS